MFNYLEIVERSQESGLLRTDNYFPAKYLQMSESVGGERKEPDADWSTSISRTVPEELLRQQSCAPLWFFMA